MDRLAPEMVGEITKNLSWSDINNLLLTNRYLYSIRHLIFDEYNKSFTKKYSSDQHVSFANLPLVVKTIAKVIIDKYQLYEPHSIDTDYDTVIFNYNFTYYTRNNHIHGDTNHMATLYLTVIGLTALLHDHDNEQQDDVYRFVNAKNIPIDEHGKITGAITLRYTNYSSRYDTDQYHDQDTNQNTNEYAIQNTNQDHNGVNDNDNDGVNDNDNDNDNDNVNVNVNDNDDNDGTYRAAYVYFINDVMVQSGFYGDSNYYIQDGNDKIEILVTQYEQMGKSHIINITSPSYDFIINSLLSTTMIDTQFTPTKHEFNNSHKTRKGNGGDVNVLPLYYDPEDTTSYDDKPPVRIYGSGITTTTHSFMTFAGTTGNIIVKQYTSPTNARLLSIRIVSDTFQLLIDNYNKDIIMTEYV